MPNKPDLQAVKALQYESLIRSFLELVLLSSYHTVGAVGVRLDILVALVSVKSAMEQCIDAYVSVHLIFEQVELNI